MHHNRVALCISVCSTSDASIIMSSGCIVCGRAVPRGETQYCCPGCAAVYTIIEQLNLEGAAKDERVAQLLEGVFPGGEEIESRDVELENGESLSLIIGGMVCPACAWLIHNRLTKLEGVGGVNVNFIAETCELHFDPMRLGRAEIELTVANLGYQTFDSGEVGGSIISDLVRVGFLP